VDATREDNGAGRAAAAATATSCWRLGRRRGALGEGQQEELRRWASSGATRGAALEQEIASGGTARGSVAVLSRGREGGRGGRRRGVPGANLQFPKIPGTSI
jgi:hypothetical protein